MQDEGKSSKQKILLPLACVFVPVALVFIVLGYFLRRPPWHDIVLGLGVALLPAGIITILYSYFVDEITRHNMRSDIREEIASLRPLLDDAHRLGVDRICPTRVEGLRDFGSHLHDEVRRAQSGQPVTLWIVCTTMRGFFML